MKKQNNIIDKLEQKDQNIVISNTSIDMALGMLMNGSDGKTLLEFEKYFGNTNEKVIEDNNKLLSMYGQNTTTDNYIGIYNSFWINQLFMKNNAINEQYKCELKKSYNAEVETIDFKTDGNKINEWVNDKTKGKIIDIVDKNSLSNMHSVLINTVYFNYDWEKPFDTIQKEEFKNIDGSTSKVDMMFNKESLYLENEYATGFLKPYSDDLYFAGILPKNMDFTVEQLNIQSLIDNAKRDYTVKIKVPKLKVEFESSLKHILMDSGIKIVFSENADLSKIAKKINVSEVLHKTVVEINEKGTEAAAATAITMRCMSFFEPEIEKEVYLDRPFVFGIYDMSTDEMLFIGKIINL